MAEWLKAHAWKACIPQGIQGSNPCLSARPFLNQDPRRTPDNGLRTPCIRYTKHREPVSSRCMCRLNPSGRGVLFLVRGGSSALRATCPRMIAIARLLREKYDLQFILIARNAPEIEICHAEAEVFRVNRLMTSHRRKCPHCTGNLTIPIRRPRPNLLQWAS